MKLDNQQVYDIAKKAFNDLKRLKKLPCTWVQTFWNSGNFFIEIDDNKIFKHTFWHDAGDGKYVLGRFKLYIKPQYWEDENTQMIDMSAKIPSNIDIEKRIQLRFMYAIYCDYLNNIINCYNVVKKPDDPITTLKNALKWYENL